LEAAVLAKLHGESALGKERYAILTNEMLAKCAKKEEILAFVLIMIDCEKMSIMQFFIILFPLISSGKLT